VLNGQSAVPGTDERLRVNAIHIKAVGLLEVIIGSATSDIHNCCPSPAPAAGPPGRETGRCRAPWRTCRLCGFFALPEPPGLARTTRVSIAHHRLRPGFSG
jgi:hypothetical protein